MLKLAYVSKCVSLADNLKGLEELLRGQHGDLHRDHGGAGGLAELLQDQREDLRERLRSAFLTGRKAWVGAVGGLDDLLRSALLYKHSRETPSKYFISPSFSVGTLFTAYPLYEAIAFHLGCRSEYFTPPSILPPSFLSAGIEGVKY